jgi:hypothetical protein
MRGLRRMAGTELAIAATFVAALAGCGTSMNSASSSSPGTMQPQSQPAVGPVLGYVWDSAGQTLRAVQGLPGASIVGTAVVSAPQGAAFIASASSGVSGAALFLDANGGVFQSSLAGGKLTKVASLPGANGLVLSNSGACALVTGKSASGTNFASVIAGLPQAPSVRSLNVSTATSIFGGAASDTGTVALAIGSGQNSAAVVAFIGQAAGTQVATPQAFGGMQFVPNSDELVVADAGSGALTAISHVNTAPASATLSAPGGIASPLALDISPNGRWVVVANHAGDVLRADLSGAAPAAKLHCSCAPTQVLALNGSTAGTTLRLVTAGGGPLWIVDAGRTAPQILFVPAIAAANVSAIATRSAL